MTHSRRKEDPQLDQAIGSSEMRPFLMQLGAHDARDGLGVAGAGRAGLRLPRP
jgi:hypothetical protein